MLNRRGILKGVGSLSLAPLVAAPFAGYAQTPSGYPTKAITVVLPFAAGNASDTGARLYARELGKRLSQSVVVENLPGGGGVRGVNRAIAAKPDGYTLLQTGIGAAITQALFNPPPYDILKDCVPISTLDGTDILILTRAESKVENLEDMLKLAASKSGGLMAGISLIGTSQHLCAELFKSRAKLSLTPVPFGSAANNLNSLMAGETDVAFEFAPSSLSLLKSGKLRALAICGPERLELLPEVPTLIEKGFADFRVTAWGMMLAPAQTPTGIVQRLNAELQDVLHDANVVKFQKNIGIRIIGGTPAEARELMSSDIKRAAEIARIAKIKLS